MKGVLKIYSKFTEEDLCRSVNLTKLQSSFIEIAPQHGCSTVILLHIFRTPLEGCCCFLKKIKLCLKRGNYSKFPDFNLQQQLLVDVLQNRCSCWSLKACQKETLTQVFSCEYCETFKNSLFYRISLVAASESETGSMYDTHNSPPIIV